MNKLFYAFLLGTFCFASVQTTAVAQQSSLVSIGVLAGGDLSFALGTGTAESTAGVSTSNYTVTRPFGIGYSGGIFGSIAFGSFAVRLEVNYNNTPVWALYKNSALTTVNTDLTEQIVLHQVSFPIAFRYYYVGGAYVELGPQVGLTIAADRTVTGTIDGRAVTEDDVILDLPIRDGVTGFSAGATVPLLNDLDIGAFLSLGYEFDFGLAVGLRYNYSFTDLYNADGIASGRYRFSSKDLTDTFASDILQRGSLIVTYNIFNFGEKS